MKLKLNIILNDFALGEFHIKKVCKSCKTINLNLAKNVRELREITLPKITTAGNSRFAQFAKFYLPEVFAHEKVLSCRKNSVRWHRKLAQTRNRYAKLCPKIVDKRSPKKNPDLSKNRKNEYFCPPSCAKDSLKVPLSKLIALSSLAKLAQIKSTIKVDTCGKTTHYVNAC